MLLNKASERVWDTGRRSGSGASSPQFKLRLSSASDRPDLLSRGLWLDSGEDEAALSAVLCVTPEEMERAAPWFVARALCPQGLNNVAEEGLSACAWSHPKTDLKGLEALLGGLVLGERRVIAWRAGFLIPLDVSGAPGGGIDPSGLQTDWNWEEPTKSAKDYFHWPNLRPNSEDDTGLQSWVRAGSCGEITILHGNYLTGEADQRPVSLGEVTLRLHGLRDKAGSTAPLKKRLSGSYIKDALLEVELHSGSASPLPFAQLLDLLSEVRHTHFSYNRKSANQPSVITLTTPDGETSTTPFGEGATFDGGIYEYLLKKFLVSKGDDSREGTGMCGIRHGLLDDRANGFLSVVVEGGSPPSWARREVNAVAHRLSELDPFGIDYNYDPEFTEADLAKARYGRFTAFGTDYFANAHTFAMLAFAGQPLCTPALQDSVNDLDEPFVLEHIHRKHMPELYARIWRLGLLQRARLQRIGQRIDALDGELLDEARSPGERRELIRIKTELLRFPLESMPAFVSTQVQGTELYDHVRFKLGVESRYNALRERVDALETHLAFKSAESASDVSAALKVAGLPLTILFLLIQLGGEPFSPWWNGWLDQGPGSSLGVALAYISIALSMAFVWLSQSSQSWWKTAERLFKRVPLVLMMMAPLVLWLGELLVRSVLH